MLRVHSLSIVLVLLLSLACLSKASDSSNAVENASGDPSPALSQKQQPQQQHNQQQPYQTSAAKLFEKNNQHDDFLPLIPAYYLTDDIPYSDGSAIEQRAAPLFVGRRNAPMFVGRRQAPMFVGRRAAPLFVGRRAATKLVGKRDSLKSEKRAKAPMFFGKRSFETVADKHHSIAKRAAAETKHSYAISKRRAPVFVGKRKAPMFVGKRHAPMFVGKRKAPMFVGKRKAPMFVGKRRAPLFVGKRFADSDDGYDLVPLEDFGNLVDVVDSYYEYPEDKRGRSPLFVGRRQAPMFVGRRQAPMFVGRRQAPLFVGRRQAPLFVGRRQAPLFVGRRQAPDFVGRRQALDFVGKREDDDEYSSWSEAAEDSFDSDDGETNISVGKRQPVTREYLENLARQVLQAQIERAREQIRNEKRLHGEGHIGKRAGDSDYEVLNKRDVDLARLERLAEEFRQMAIEDMREKIQNDKRLHGPGWVGKRDDESSEYDLEDFSR